MSELRFEQSSYNLDLTPAKPSLARLLCVELRAAPARGGRLLGLRWCVPEEAAEARAALLNQVQVLYAPEQTDSADRPDELLS